MSIKKLGSTKLTDDVLVSSVNLASEVTGILGVANGGTGQSVFTNGQLLIGNTTGNTLTKATLTAGSGISITNGAGSISIAATAVSSQWTTNGSDIYYNTGNVGIGITTPQAPLSFANTVGNKIDLYHGAAGTGDRYGFAIAPDTLLIFQGAQGAVTGGIAFGTSSSSVFTEYGRFSKGGSFLVGDTIRPSEGGTWNGTAVFGINGSNKVIAGYLNSTTTGAYIGGHNSAMNDWATLNIAGKDIIFRYDQTERMRLDGANGRLGILTSTPAGPLHVLTAGVGTWGDFVVTSTSLWGDSGTQYVTIGAGGAAGIMIYNPHIVWNASTSAAAIRLGRSGGVSGGAWYEIGTKASDAFWISKNAGATPQFYIDSSGNIGIGTTSPDYRLTVLTPTSDATIGFNLRAYTTGADGDRTTISRYTSSNNNNWAWHEAHAWAHIWKCNGVEQMRLTSGGNVGIGTTSPLARLSVGSGSLSDGNVPVQISTGSATGLVYFGANKNGGYGALFGYDNSSFGGAVVRNVNSGEGISFVINNTSEVMRIISGNVGIGTTSPTVHSGTNSALVVRGAGTSRGIIELWDGNGTGKAVFQQVANTTYIGNLAGAGDLVLLTNGLGSSASESMTIKANGNVCIGTTSLYSGSMVDIRRDQSTGTILRVSNDSTNVNAYAEIAVGSYGNNRHLVMGASYNYTAPEWNKAWVYGVNRDLALKSNSGQIQIYTGGTSDSYIRTRWTVGGTLLQGGSSTPYEPAWRGTAVFGVDGYDKVMAGSLDNTTIGAYVAGHNSALTDWAPLNLAGSAVIWRINQTEYARLSSTGKVGIGLTSPDARLDVLYNNGSNGSAGYADYGILTRASSGQATIGAIFDGDGYANLNLGSVESGNNYFWHISKRTVSDGRRIEFYFHNGPSGFGSKGYITTSGTWHAADFVLTSDRRRKTELLQITDALSKVLSWAGYTYRPIDGERRRAGLMAQDVEPTAPETVYEDEQGIKGLSYEQMIPYLVEAIRDLNAKIEALA